MRALINTRELGSFGISFTFDDVTIHRISKKYWDQDIQIVNSLSVSAILNRAGRYTGIKSMLRYFVCTDIDIKQIFLYRQTGIL